MKTVFEVDPKDIEFAAFNPRGEKPKDIQSDPSYIQLKDSVYKYGVLVPLVIQMQSGPGRKPFRLIDGERRLRAALETKATKVPVRITDAGEPLSNIIQAFHIHMLRKQWSQVPQTRGLKKILKYKKWEGREKFSEEELEELQTLTGCTKIQLRPLLRAIRYDDSVLDDVENKRLGYSHLVQIEESLVERIEAEYPSLLQEIPKGTIRQKMVQKAKKNIIPDTRSLMMNVAPVISRASTPSEKKAVEGLLRKFINEDDMAPEQVLKKFEYAHPMAQADVLERMRQILDAAEALETLLIHFQAHDAKSWPDMAHKIETRLDKIRKLISSKIRGLKGTALR